MSSTDKHWAETLKELYEKGASDVEVCKELGVTTAKFEQMMKENAQFRKLVEYGRTLAQAWWMGHARTALFNKAFNHSLWLSVMKNRFGWTDKGAGDSEIPDAQRSVEELRDQMKKILPKVIKQFSNDLTEGGLLEKTSSE